MLINFNKFRQQTCVRYVYCGERTRETGSPIPLSATQVKLPTNPRASSVEMLILLRKMLP